jgi:hypothetical protein
MLHSPHLNFNLTKIKFIPLTEQQSVCYFKINDMEMWEDRRQFCNNKRVLASQGSAKHCRFDAAFNVRCGIQNIPDWCRHLYSSCGSAKHRSQQAKLWIPGSNATFCGDCMKTCEDVAPNFGENRPWCFTTTTPRLTLPSSGETQNGCHPPHTVFPWFGTLRLLPISKNKI